jgi:sulfide:quinone oxidoreductase
VSDEATLARLEQRLIHIERVLGRLETQAGELPGLVGTVGDTFDSLVARLADRGVDVDARLHDVLRLVERMTAPETVRATEGLLVHLDAIASLARSGVLDRGSRRHRAGQSRTWVRGARSVIRCSPCAGLLAGGGLGQGWSSPRRCVAKHYYQPLWTLVGAGVGSSPPKEVTERDRGRLHPRGVTWIRDSVAELRPREEARHLGSAAERHLRPAGRGAGHPARLGQDRGPGRPPRQGRDRAPTTATTSSTRPGRPCETLQRGNAVFTFPSTPVKCAGAPQKIMYLADEHLRRRGVRAKTPKVIFASRGAGSSACEELRRGAEPRWWSEGIETLPPRPHRRAAEAAKRRCSRHLDRRSRGRPEVRLLHVVPPQSAPDVIKQEPARDPRGWVDVHKHTLQHVRYPDVFALGDASSLPTSRTGAAIRKQAPVLVENLLALRAGRALGRATTATRRARW